MSETYTTSIPPHDRLSLKEIRETLYRCRDFELTLLWQRSLFLFGFLSLSFTGYGVLAVQAVNGKNLLYIYEYMFGIALFGIILSIIWIYMVKGSKAWFEVYEDVVCSIEKETNPYPKYRMGVYAENRRNDFGNSFWNNQAGAYSPSKVNIMIGWIMFCIWSVCETISVYNVLTVYSKNDFSFPKIAISLCVIGILVWVTPKIIENFIKSRPLRPIKEQKKENTEKIITNSIYRIINHYANEKLEAEILEKIKNDDRINKNGNINIGNKEYSDKIANDVNELITNKAGEKTEMIINQFIENEIETKIKAKISELVDSKITEIQQLIKITESK